jgi:hypothetical protein
MYIIVNASTNIIVGTATKPVSVEACSKNGQKVYEIPDHKFTLDMIGSKLKLNDKQV